MWIKYFKTIFDFIAAFFLLVLFSPLFLMLWILVVIFLGGRPAIFKQKRPGYQEKIFYLYKFRSMSNAKNEGGELLPDCSRLNTFGKMLRSTSLDELPQLWNILKGDMSFIGPRPLLPEYLPLYNSEQRRRHLVKPGLTGWAQVNGRNAITWQQKFDFDCWYIDNKSFTVDIKILWLTILKLLKKDGVNVSESITMELFKGNKKN